MNNPDLPFGIVTQNLPTAYSQGVLYNYLASYALNMLEQLSATLSCGY